jgi:alpha,alpha-trehalase
MPLRTSAAAAAAAFDALPRDAAGAVPREALAAFVGAHFLPAGADAVAGPPPGWSEDPGLNFLPSVPPGPVRDAALTLHSLWPALCRRQPPPPRPPSSLIGTTGWTVVPGSRFRESYYWDAYWTVRGLLASGLVAAAAGVVSTLAQLAAAAGFVPNGARTYYAGRSQPPLLADAAAALLAGGGEEGRGAALAALPAAVADHGLWTRAPRLVRVRDAQGRVHELARYCAVAHAPRAEAWREDSAAAAGLPAAALPSLYTGIASACESGWDFSSRWLAGGVAGGGAAPCPAPGSATVRRALAHLVLPVDLNAILVRSERALGRLCAAAGDEGGAARWAAAADARWAAVEALLWCEAEQRWTDLSLAGVEAGAGGVFDAASLAASPFVSAACWAPLWAAPAPTPRTLAAVTSLASSGLVGAGGVATTPLETGEQWDGRNAWPPLQTILAEGCLACGGSRGASLACTIVASFVGNAAAGIGRDGCAREKYRADAAAGAPGGGGEYATQTGFGWTHGAVLCLLRRFGWPPEEGRAVAAGEAGDA